MEALILILLPIVFIILGLVIAAVSLIQRQKVMASQRWPTTSAQLTRIELDEQAGQDGDAQEVLVSYTYRAGSGLHEGHTLAFGYSSSTSPDYHRRIYTLLKGKKIIRIHYNPQAPHESVISVQAGNGILVGLVVGGFFCLFGLGFLMGALGILPVALIMGLLAVILLSTVGFCVYWIGLRKGDPLINDLKTH